MGKLPKSFLDRIITTIENKWVWLIGIPLAAFICFFLVPFLLTQFCSNIVFDADSGVIGDTLGGIVSPILGFIAIILTFAAFYIQYKANIIQQDNFFIQQFESKFFDLLKIHRENVNDFEIKNHKGRGVFAVLRAEFLDIYTVVNDNVKFNDDAINKYKADVAYIFLYYGIGNSTSPLIKEFTNKYNCPNDIEKINDILSSRRELGTEKLNFLKGFTFNEKYFPFSGHQMRLSHYFRHLYETVKYVETEDKLSDEEKTYYIKILRAQFSTHEEAILFYNSISSIGKAWRKKCGSILGILLNK
jgi:hypothetical protein